jgi:diaminopimelate epimerase
MELAFIKMQGIGNDFVVADCLIPEPAPAAALQAAAVRLCDRKFGVGADGVILVLPSATADFQMRMFNPDGSEAEMCGNGIRCFAKYVFDHGYTDRTEIRVDTLGGVMVLSLSLKNGTVDRVKVDMGAPRLDRADLPMVGEPGRVIDQPVTVAGETVALTGVSMGNPHVIFFADPATDAHIDYLGPVLEKHALFPRRTNVHAVEVISPTEIKMLTWERGAGRTLACGTGACACAVAANLNGLTGRRVLVHLAGGDLSIEWSEEDGHVYMTGPAEEVFAGTIALA